MTYKGPPPPKKKKNTKNFDKNETKLNKTK